MKRSSPRNNPKHNPKVKGLGGEKEWPVKSEDQESRGSWKPSEITWNTWRGMICFSFPWFSHSFLEVRGPGIMSFSLEMTTVVWNARGHPSLNWKRILVFWMLYSKHSAYLYIYFKPHWGHLVRNSVHKYLSAHSMLLSLLGIGNIAVNKICGHWSHGT